MRDDHSYEEREKLTRRQWRFRILSRRLLVPCVFAAVIGVLSWMDYSGVFSPAGNPDVTSNPGPKKDSGSELHPDIEKYDKRWFRVVNSIDGDTFDVEIPDGRYRNTRIRLLGVDTPEVSWEKGRITGCDHFGREACQYTRNRTAGKMVKLILSSHQTRCRHGRLLAYVELKDGSMLNRDIIRHGYGFADSRSKHPCMDEFEKLMKQAKNSKTGLWKNPKDLPWYVRNKR